MVASESRRVTIAPSLLAADFGRLKEAVAASETAAAHRLHLDVVDGQCVPNLSFGPDVPAALHKRSKPAVDIRVIMTPIDSYLDVFGDASADHNSVHPGADTLIAGTPVFHAPDCRQAIQALRGGT